MKRLVKLVGILCITIAVFSANQAMAQKRVVQLSGVVLLSDSITPMPGTHVYVPAAGRGTTSSLTGFFSLPLVVGDSVVFSHIGLKRKSYTIPDDAPEYTTLIVVMRDDTIQLQAIDIVAFPTEEAFKMAILAMGNLPADQSPIDGNQMNSDLMALMVRTTPMDASANYRYYMNQQPQDIQNRFQPITNPFLNIVNWAKFFKTMKQQKKEREKESQRNRIPD